MTKAMRKTWLAAAVGLTCLGASGAWALDPVASNNTGVFTVRIQPNVDLGVIVDTTGSAWVGSANLDVAMDLGAEKVLGTGVRLEVAGNFQSQEFALSAADAATWLLDADETGTENQLRLYGMIGANQATPPAGALFAGVANLITTVLANAGQSNANEPSASPGAGHVYELNDNAGAVYDQIDNLAVATQRRLWLRANTPPTTTTDVQQAFVVTVTAASGAAN